jgi:hypothetical protein
MMKIKRVSMVALPTVLLVGMASPASAVNNSVYNGSDIAIGAIQVLDGNYKHGNYDDLIPSGAHSGYPKTQGVFIGAGYCGRFSQRDANVTEFYDGPQIVSTIRAGITRSWDVYAYLGRCEA